MRCNIRPRIALVTGASRGIGRQIALSLVNSGYRVGLVARASDDLLDLKMILGNRVRAYPCDIQDTEECASVVEDMVRHWGGVDVLVNNASALWWKPLAETPIERWDLMHGINARATYQFSRLCLPYMVAGGWGHIITHAPPFTPDSVKGLLGSGAMCNRVAYMSSKLGMSIVSAGVAAEIAANEVNVASTTIWPSTAIRSEATRHHKMGRPEMWREPKIMSDMLEHLLQEEDLGDLNGSSLIDQTYLESKGVTDFSRYQCVEGYEPPPLDTLLGFRKRE